MLLVPTLFARSTEKHQILIPWLGLTHQARIHHDTVAFTSSAVDVTPSIHVSNDRLEHVSASQAQILKVLQLMDCGDGYESSVRRLPHIDVRRHVQYENELDAATIQRIDNVFHKGIKARARMLLPHMKLIDDSNFKNAFSIKSLLAPMEKLTLAKEGSEVHPLICPFCLHPYTSGIKYTYHHQRCAEVQKALHLP